MAFNWRREPSNPYLPADGSLAQLDANSMASYKPLTAMTPHGNGMNGYFSNDAVANQSQGFSVPNQQHGGMGQPELDGYGASLQAASDAAAQAQAREQEIAKIQSQIETLQARIAENQAKLKNWNGGDVANKIAELEARKFFSQDPTSIWRWKTERDEARRLANEQKNNSDNVVRANALFEIQNDLDSIIVDESMTSQDQKAYLSKLSNLKTLAQKNNLPVDAIDKKIKEVKGETEQPITNVESNEQLDTSDFSGTDIEKNDSAAQVILNSKNPSVQDLDKVIHGNVNRDLKVKAKNLREEVIKKNKQAEEDAKKEQSLLGKKNLTSKEIQFMEGRKDVKKYSDDYGNIWFTRGSF